MNKCVYLTTIVVILFSCTNKNKERIKNENFITEKSLVAQKIPISEILKPVDMIKLKDFVIFQNEYIRGEPCFFVFSAKDMEFHYCFAKLGQGPGEYIAPRFVQNALYNRQNSISIFDSASDKIYKYEIDSEKETLLSESKVRNIHFPTQNISYVNDSTLLFQILTNDKVSLYSYSSISKKILDSLQFKTQFKQIMGENYNPNIDFYNYSNYKNMCVAAFNFINELKVFSLNESGKFVITDKTMHLINKTPFIKERFYHNNFYYMFPIITSNKIFALYYGLPFIYLQPFPINKKGRSFSFHIEVYDYDNTPIALLKLDSDILRICVDEINQKIYAWNPNKDFDYLLIYDISVVF